MAFYKNQFKELIEDVLKEVGLYSPEAVELLLGTAAQESKFGTYIHQLGKGQAHGVFQIERLTFNDLQNRFSKRFPEISGFTFEQLRWDLRASIIMARIKYLSCPGALPKTLSGQAAYWKKWYNTYLGAGTAEQYLNSYQKYCA